jgi:hypothetical protein
MRLEVGAGLLLAETDAVAATPADAAPAEVKPQTVALLKKLQNTK